MRVELSSNQSVELRDEWLRGDRRAVHNAVNITVNADGGRVVSLTLEDLAIEALLTRRIVSWTLPQPIPSQLVNPTDVYDRLSDADGEALAEAVRPHYHAIMGIKSDDDAGTDPKDAVSAPPTISGSVLSTTSSDAPAPPAPSPTNGTNGIGLPSTFSGPPSR